MCCPTCSPGSGLSGRIMSRPRPQRCLCNTKAKPALRLFPGCKGGDDLLKAWIAAQWIAEGGVSETQKQGARFPRPRQATNDQRDSKREHQRKNYGQNPANKVTMPNDHPSGYFFYNRFDRLNIQSRAWKKMPIVASPKITGKITRQYRSIFLAGAVRWLLCKIVVTKTSIRQKKTSKVLVKIKASRRVV